MQESNGGLIDGTVENSFGGSLSSASTLDGLRFETRLVYDRGVSDVPRYHGRKLVAPGTVLIEVGLCESRGLG